MEIDTMCAEFFLENQDRLFPKPVAENVEEALMFLQDCFAGVFADVDELKEFMEDEGIDITEYDDITEALEVFALPDGRYLYVEA